jgi:hypothetical protein
MKKDILKRYITLFVLIIESPFIFIARVEKPVLDTGAQIETKSPVSRW